MNVRELIAELKKHPGDAAVKMRVEVCTEPGFYDVRGKYQTGSAPVSSVSRNGDKVTLS